MTPKRVTAIIENIRPIVDGGRYPVKRIAGEDLVVEADVFKDGHDIVAALLKWRPLGRKNWQETPMALVENDRWTGTGTLFDLAPHEYTVEAWTDTFLSWQHEFEAKFKGGITELESETLEGAQLVADAAKRAGRSADARRLKTIAEQIRKAEPAEVNDIAFWTELEALMATYPDRSQSCEYKPYLRCEVDREKARYAAWYEFFPRCAEGKAESGSTFRDCLPRIDDAKAMGFDVIYFPPIHPIGISNRKGANNTVACEPGEPGVPYAIGNRHQDCPNGGGHKDVAPELGTLEDLAWLIDRLEERDLELALDFAINCSPDHPYVEQHPDWFYKRPDGTIKYAENPPKKYQDVYPLNFHCADWKALWKEMADVILFWCEQRVRIFRVDNPHTKPVSFWEYLIGTVREKYPDALFLSEAFTKPKMMKALAKAGFQQSYTYFTWRNFKAELQEYFTELTQTEMREYFTGNLFPNTPDILPFFLQTGGRPAFMIRAVLATTLSSVWGMYSGFELCENAALPGREEYLDSEKYQWKGRDWDAKGNIKDYITRLNHIRRDNRALHEYDNLRFYKADNENVLFYGKMTAARDNLILVAVNLDPHQSHHSFIHVPIEEFGLTAEDTYQVHDLLTDARYLWKGSRNFIELDPEKVPAHIFRVRRWVSREENFDYFM